VKKLTRTMRKAESNSLNASSPATRTILSTHMFTIAGLPISPISFMPDSVIYLPRSVRVSRGSLNYCLNVVMEFITSLLALMDSTCSGIIFMAIAAPDKFVLEERK